MDCHISLKGGLHIWIQYMEGDYLLRIGRQRVEPSAVEWRTVLNNWMWVINRLPDRTEEKMWFFLSARIPDRKVVQLGFDALN